MKHGYVNILSSGKVLTQDKAALFERARDVCFGSNQITQADFPQAAAVQLGILLSKCRECKEINMFVCTSAL